MGSLLESPIGGAPFLFLLLGAIAASCSISLGLIAASRLVGRIFSNTLGRRLAQASKLRYLACGVRVEYLEDELGVAALLSSRPVDDDQKRYRTCRTYLLQDCIVQVHCDFDGVVEAFFISTLNARFAPRLGIPWGGKPDQLLIKLGRTRYKDVKETHIESASGWAGARRQGYHEVHSLGNPGYYQSYILGSNDITSIGWPKENSEWSNGLMDPSSESISIDSPPDWLGVFRQTAAPNTFGVVGPHLDANLFTSSVGPEADSLRVIPRTYSAPWREKS